LAENYEDLEDHNRVAADLPHCRPAFQPLANRRCRREL